MRTLVKSTINRLHSTATLLNGYTATQLNCIAATLLRSCTASNITATQPEHGSKVTPATQLGHG